jgi:hypothetical protein
MAAPDIEVVEVSLLSGRSDRPSMTFTPGTPAPTVSLGNAGQWAIAGEGVGPVHVFVTFDGQSVHVAAAIANLPVALAGAPITTAWTKAPIPCELRFGGACVILRRTSRPGAFTQEEATVHDGGALWQQAAQRANAPGAPSPALMASQIPSVRPAAGMPAEPTQAMIPPQQYTSSHPPGPIDLSATTPMADAPKFREAVAAAEAAAAGRPPLESSPTTVRQRAPGTGAPPTPVPEPLGELEKTVIAPHPPRPPQGIPDMTAGLAGERPPPQAMPPGAVYGGAPPAAIQEEKPLNFWQAASPVKKATLVLMPFALIMAFLMLHDDPPKPPRVAAQKHAVRDAGALAAVASHDGGAGSAAVDVDSGGATTATNNATNAIDAGAAPNGSLDAKQDAKDQSSTGKPTPTAASKRTPERLALDKVAAGSFDDAAKQYDALVASHADDPSYKEAARILHEKAGN